MGVLSLNTVRANAFDSKASKSNLVYQSFYTFKYQLHSIKNDRKTKTQRDKKQWVIMRWNKNFCIRLIYPFFWKQLRLNDNFCVFTSQSIIRSKVRTESTHLLHKGKYHCTTDLLFDYFGFSSFAYVELDRDFQVWSNPNQSNRRSVVQWYFPLQCKWVFSG